MSQSSLRETVALTSGKEKQGSQYTRVPIELGIDKRGSNSGTLSVCVQYRASKDRTIEIPLDSEELRRLHDLTGHILDE